MIALPLSTFGHQVCFHKKIMRNTGYVAVGHLVGHKTSRTDYVNTLRHFVKILNITLDDDQIDKKSSLWRYEEFFKVIKIKDCVYRVPHKVSGLGGQ
jgi:hypothetical protein